MPAMRAPRVGQYKPWGRSHNVDDDTGKVFVSRVFDRSGNGKRGNGSRGYGK